jgi:hypothetical protein
VLGFPDRYFCGYLIGLGYPVDRPLRPIVRPNHRPFDEVVHWDRWWRTGEAATAPRHHLGSIHPFRDSQEAATAT